MVTYPKNTSKYHNVIRYNYYNMYLFLCVMTNNDFIFLNLFCHSDELLKEIEALYGKSFVFKVNVALENLEILAKVITVVRVITDEVIEFAHCGDLLDSKETYLDSKFENDKVQGAEDVALGDEAESPITVMGSILSNPLEP